MIGIEESMGALAAVIALLGLVPAGLALATERRRAGPGAVRPSWGEAPAGRAPAGEPAGLAAIAPVDAASAVLAAGRAGYAGVTEIGWEGGGWALRALGTAGRGVRLRVDGWTGRVTPCTG